MQSQTYMTAQSSSARESGVFFLACALIVMNLIDALFTLGFIHMGAATEANPLMDALLAGGPVLFVVGKMALVSLGVTLLWRLRHRRAAVAGLAAATAVYAMLCIYHITAAHAVASQLAVATF